ncbi:MAG TPA: hypothetical protein VGM88_24185 [Kofleriaceae bacterium]|jgi:hypothetical protein
MKSLAFVLCIAALGCGKKSESPSVGSGSAPAPVAKASCPPDKIQNGASCESPGSVVPPTALEAVTTQQSRIDELGKTLDHVEAISAPIELLNGIRQLDEWKQVAATSTKLQVVDQVVATLNDALTKLRAFRASLGTAAQKLGNLRGELDALLASPAGQDLEALRTKYSKEIRDTVQPLATEATDAIQHAIAPLEQQLSDTGDLIIGACAMAKLSGGSDQLKALCAQAKDVFAKANAYLADFKAKPAQLVTDLTAQLESHLLLLIDDGTKTALDAAQKQVNDALKLPAGSGSGS